MSEELGVFKSNSSGTYLESYGHNPVWDANGNLIQCIIPSGYNYFRVQSDYIGIDSVITIDEPIDE